MLLPIELNKTAKFTGMSLTSAFRNAARWGYSGQSVPMWTNDNGGTTVAGIRVFFVVAGINFPHNC